MAENSPVLSHPHCTSVVKDRQQWGRREQAQLVKVMSPSSHNRSMVKPKNKPRVSGAQQIGSYAAQIHYREMY